jgi:hypothetical protein
MINIKKTAATFAATGVMIANMAMPALAAPGYTLFGDATIVSGGNPGNAVKLTSDADPGYGGIDYAIPAGTTFADLTTLSTDYFVESDDLCAGGSPRFQINVIEGGVEKNIHVYFEQEPGNVCPVGTWTNTGDELENTEAVDTSQLTGGTFYDPYATALAKYGSLQVTGVQLVVDAGWAMPDGEQTILVDNTNIDGTIYTYEPNTPKSKDQCKKGGWQSLEDANGQPFKNQGQCVSYFNHQ